jgi:hypothetical protein
MQRLHLPVALGMMLMASSCYSATPDLSQLVPQEIDGFKAVETDGLYDHETLFQYIDGGAEVYRALNVRRVFARRYANASGSEIIADLFDMGSASDAFGAYHHDMREGENADIGQESEYADGTLAFWKGDFFVSIVALAENAESDRAVLELGRSISSKIGAVGEPPELRRLLPEQGLLSAQVHYFHTYDSFGRYHYLAEENILQLDRQTEGLLASYRSETGGAAGSARHVVLLVRYPSEEHAGRALEGLRERFHADAAAKGIGQTQSGEWFGVRSVDRLLIGVFDAPAQKTVEQSLQGVLRRVEGGSGPS